MKRINSMCSNIFEGAHDVVLTLVMCYFILFSMTSEAIYFKNRDDVKNIRCSKLAGFEFVCRSKFAAREGPIPICFSVCLQSFPNKTLILLDTPLEFHYLRRSKIIYLSFYETYVSSLIKKRIGIIDECTHCKG